MQEFMDNKENSGKWVLCAFIGFFIVFCSVDAYFVYTAIRTNTGLVTENSYYKGLDYNETLNLAKRQQKSGFTGSAKIEDGNLIFSLKDKDGNAIPGANVTATLTIPTHDGFDFEILLNEFDQGNYKAVLNLPKNGLWNAQLEAKWLQQSYKTNLNFTIP